jgi:outer membrane protein assembly factor BamB
MRHAPIRRTLGLAAAFWLTALAAANGDDWTRFRGPNGTGTSTDTSIPVQFKDGDGILWKVALPGKGNSSPIVSRGKVFTQSASDNGGQRMLLCLDAASGQTLWNATLPGGQSKMHQHNTLASSTPTVDGERVYAMWWTGTGMVLTAHDYDGHFQWQYDLGPYRSEHGAGASPVEYGGRVYVNYDQDRIDSQTKMEIPGAEHRTALYCFDGKTGQVLWRQERKGHRACYSTPILRPLPAGGQELIAINTNTITAYDPVSGAVNWNWSWDWSRNNNQIWRTIGTPMIWKDLLLAQAGDGTGASTYFVAIRMGSPSTPAQLVWEAKKGNFPYVPSIIVSGDYIYAVHDARGIAGCYEAATGKEVWTERLSGEFRSSPVCVDGKIYACNDKGDVFVYPAAPEFKLLAKNSLGERILATPAVVNGRMYIRGATHLYCIGKAG